MEGFSFQTKEYICAKTEEELGIGEKRVKWKECCSKSFLRSVFLFLAEEREEGTVLLSSLSLLLEISAFLLIRCFDLEARVEERKKNAMALILPCGTKERILSETEWLREGACNRCAAIGVRGAFLSCATVMDPMKGYHAAFSLREEREERELASLLDLCGLTMKRGLQKGKRILYLKDSSQIEDLLSLVGAERFAMRMMDCKIEKSIRGNINRRQNFDGANLKKTVDGSQSVIAAIHYLEEKGFLPSLPESLQDAAKLRMNYPEISLRELCDRSEEKLTKSGLNHRLQKLVRLAEQYRKEGEEHA